MNPDEDFDAIHWGVLDAARDVHGATPSYIAGRTSKERTTIHWLLQDLMMDGYVEKQAPGFYVLVEDPTTDPDSDLDAGHWEVVNVLRTSHGFSPAWLRDRLDIDSRYTLTRRLRDLVKADLLDHPNDGYYLLAADPDDLPTRPADAAAGQ